MKKNYTLKRELTFLMILTSVCTLLSVCAAVFYVFFLFSSFQKTQEDIEYVLRYTSQQYEAHMQFIEDSVIAIRHNTVLDDFFSERRIRPGGNRTTAFLQHGAFFRAEYGGTSASFCYWNLFV